MDKIGPASCPPELYSRADTGFENFVHTLDFKGRMYFHS
jgi:hypothetical protein